MSDGPGGLSLDEILELLRHRQRREVLRLLRGGDEPLSVETVVDRLSPGEPPGDRKTAFAHVHGPKLADAGVIEYDRRRQTVRYRADDRIERALSAIDQLETDLEG